MEPIQFEPAIKNSILSNKEAQFESNRIKEIPTLIEPTQYKLPAIMQNYAYPVSTWPVVISEKMQETLAQLCVRIPQLIKAIPELYFKNDEKRIADFYFKGNEMVTQFAMICHQKNVETGCRLDLTYSKDDFKILEVNVGSSIGGWQVQSFEKIIRSFHPQLTDPVTATTYESRNSQAIYMKFLVDKILAQVQPTDEMINVFVGVGHIESEKIKQDVIDFFGGLLKKEFAARGLKGQAHTGKFASLTLKNSKLYHKDEVMHGVVAFKVEEDEQVPADVFRAFIMDQVYFPDHLATGIYGDKRNLGLLRELAEQQAFSAEDNELILQHIPWSSEITPKNVSYAGETSSIVDILRKYKDKLVIKAAQGYQGKDVFIGKFSSEEEWEEAIKIALTAADFIAQEYNESINFLAPNGQQEWTDHKLIWGAFGFGPHYGGVWVRLSEVANDVGVINSATGAVEAIVYEIKK